MQEEVAASGTRRGAPPDRFRVLGVPLDPVTETDILEACAFEIDAPQDRPLVIASQNVHGLHTYFNDPDFRAVHEHPRTLVHIDGTPLIWLGRLKGQRVRFAHRTGCIDWVPQLFACAARQGWRVFYLGSRPEALCDGVAAVRSTHPELAIGGHHGHFAMDGPTNREVMEQIKAFAPDILCVGMGMGRQERWILRHLDQLEVSIIITTGACLDLIGGHLRVAPRWLGPLGLEWSFRLYDDWRSTARRYLIEPWQLMIDGARYRRTIEHRQRTQRPDSAPRQQGRLCS